MLSRRTFQQGLFCVLCTLIRVHGELISGTGLKGIVQAAGINIIGLKNAVCDVNDIKKARYVIEVLAPCLYKLLMEAFIKSNVNNFDDWLKHQDNTMLKYWYGILDFEITLLLYNRCGKLTSCFLSVQ